MLRYNILVYVCIAKFRPCMHSTSYFKVSLKESYHGNHSFQAPCEAEAQCAAMVKAGVVYATATEDMDSLTFGSNIMLRHLTASEAK